MAKKIWAIVVVTFIILVLALSLAANMPGKSNVSDLLISAYDRSLSFVPRTSKSPDGKYELKQSSKEGKDNVNSLYFEITKAGDKTPLVVSDCMYRLYDFKYLGWGIGTDDVWVVSGDVGVFCYVSVGDGKWVEYLVGYTINTTDDVWVLDVSDIDGKADVPKAHINRSTVPQEVIDFLKQ